MAILEQIEINEVPFDLSPVSQGEVTEPFSIADENGKAVVVFSGGDIITKNFNSSARELSVMMERGGITSAGNDAYDEFSVFYANIRTAMFVHPGGATYVQFPMSGTLYQFDSDNELLSSSLVSTSPFPLDEGCDFIRFTSATSSRIDRMVVRFYGGQPYESKRVRLRETLSERLIYAVDESVCTTARLVLPPNYTTDGKKVPLIIWDSGDGSFRYWWQHEIGDSYPGRIAGIEYLRDSGFAVLEIYSWGSYYFQTYPDCGGRSAMPIPTHLATHEKGVEYVLSRYNIDPENIFHISKSGSGKIALFYALQKPSFNLRSIYAMAPVFDDLTFVGWGNKNYRQALFDELNMRGDTETEGTPAYQYINGTPVADGGYNGTSWAMHSDKGKQFINENADKFTPIVPGWMNLCGQTIAEKIADTHAFSAAFWEGYTYDSETGNWSWTGPRPATRGDVCYTRDNLVMIGNHIPFTVIMSPTDEQTPYWDALEVVKQLLNGGDEASMVTLATGGHSGPDLSDSSVWGDCYVENVTTALGIEYAGVSIGWYLAVQDIYARFLR